jgi:hypothetical protein
VRARRFFVWDVGFGVRFHAVTLGCSVRELFEGRGEWSLSERPIGVGAPFWEVSLSWFAGCCACHFVPRVAPGAIHIRPLRGLLEWIVNDEFFIALPFDR